MNTQSSPHTQSQEPQEPLGNIHSGVRKASAIVSIATMINVAVPAPISPSIHTLTNDTVGKAMTFVPPTQISSTQKAEVNVPKLHNILVKYTIQPGDTISALACVFGVKKANLLKHNPQITDEDYIRAEDILIIPNPSRNIAKCVEDNRVEIKEKIKTAPEITPTIESIESYKQPGFRETFLMDDTNVRLLIDYAKRYHLDDFKVIHGSKKMSILEKKQKLFKLYEEDHITFGKRPYIQQIKDARFDEKITKNTEVLLRDAGYTATAKDILNAKMQIESSGGLFIVSIKEAQELTEDYGRIQQRIETLKKDHYKITDMSEMRIWRQDFAKQIGLKSKANKGIADKINKAVKQIIGDKNDIGPHGITSNWVRNEMKEGWNPGCELKFIDDIDYLRQEVRKIFAEAVKDNLSPEQIMKRLVVLDSRFDSKLMGDAVLFSFDRITSEFIKQGVSPQQSVKKANIIYNGHGKKAKDYAEKMDTILRLVSAFNKPQAGAALRDKSPIKHKNRDIAPVKHGIDPSKVGGGEIERDPITGAPLCSRTARNGLLESGANPEKVDQDDAIKLMDRWVRTKKGKSFNNPDMLRAYLVSRAKKKGKVLGDMTMNTPNGHRAYSFFGIDEKLYVSDIYRGDKEAPMLFDDYMEKNWGKSFTRVVVNTHVGKIYNPSAKFVVNIQKEPTPMPIIMASAPAGTVPVMIQSDGVYKLSQGISTSVVKLTDDTVGDNHLRTDADVGDNNKMLFPAATTSARIRNLIDYRIAQINILLSNVTDPVVKARIEKKLGENPAWTMTQNIKLQKKRYMKGGDVQALKNAKGLYALLVMCEQELAKIPAFNKMAA